MGAVAISASPSGLHFSKMHGAGNDFVMLDLRGNPALVAKLSSGAQSLCRALADRRTGIGCDQVLAIEPARSADALASYRIWNADGSPSQQCGNGARCVAAWLVRDGASFDKPGYGDGFFLDSPAGMHAVDVLGDDRYRIAMGMPQFAPQAIPLAGFREAQDSYAAQIAFLQGERSETVRFGAVSMGNPHAVIEVDDIDRAPVAATGAALQRNAAFPESVNVGFVEVLARDYVRLRVFERGVGETPACGSGACAAAAVLIRRGRVDRELTVSLPGGDLRIHWPDDAAPITLAGPAAFVFEGEWLQ